MEKDSLFVHDLPGRVAALRAGRKLRARRWVRTAAILSFIVFLLCCAMLLLGSGGYSPGVVLRALRGEIINERNASWAVTTVRLPRMLAGLFAGFAFGLAGSIFQTMFRNPLANPNIIGITSGSSAGAVFCIMLLHAGSGAVYGASIATGLLTALVMFALASLGGRYSTSRMILIGIGVQAVLNAVVSYILIRGSEKDVPTAMRWMSGSLNGAELTKLYPLFIFTALLTPVVLIYAKKLAMLQLGEDAALMMGVDARRTRWVLLLSSVCLAATATAATGPIAFVSFLSGPIARRLAGNGSSNPLPAGLFGAALVLASDLAGQFAFEQRFPVGIVTGLLGAPYLIYLLIRMNRTGEF